jgi:hypothetical protein
MAEAVDPSTEPPELPELPELLLRELEDEDELREPLEGELNRFSAFESEPPPDADRPVLLPDALKPVELDELVEDELEPDEEEEPLEDEPPDDPPDDLPPPPPPPPKSPIPPPPPGPRRLPRSWGESSEAKRSGAVVPVSRIVRSRRPDCTVAVRTASSGAWSPCLPGASERACQSSPLPATIAAGSSAHKARLRFLSGLQGPLRWDCIAKPSGHGVSPHRPAVFSDT